MRLTHFALLSLTIIVSACAPVAKIEAVILAEPVADVAGAPAPPSDEVRHRPECPTISPTLGDGIGGTGCAED